MTMNPVDDSLLPEEEITPANQRMTSKFLTKFEISAAVSLRARDIISGQFKYGKGNGDNNSSSTVEGDEQELASRNKKKKHRKDDNADSSSDDSSDSDSESKKKQKQQQQQQKQKEEQEENNDNPMNSIENQARVKSLPMIFSDPVMIAKHELVNKKLPFIVKRCLGADLPPQSVLNTARGKQKYRVEIIPIGELELDIRSIDLGDWIF